ncbi:uncharacterized protein C8R40DRAFT_1173928 [Lentinula edodes]|uniref:uncharacterized protein n=1 Tax=Lentinula edodes TaxID=5353 RepID=UPI001E8EDD50|nr:uncharacterized protein C8R40DRAFT_1173928 [Lentinula edodes]KAH7872203.1 hypothetical protein C8R40DRAFT_1173928 [Lentinula edodes]
MISLIWVNQRLRISNLRQKDKVRPAEQLPWRVPLIAPLLGTPSPWRRAANTGKKDTQHNNLFGSPPQVIARSNNAPTPPPPSFQNMHIPNILHILLLSTISRRAGYTGIEDDIMANVDFCPGNLPGPSYGHSDYKAGLQTSVFLDFPVHGPILNETSSPISGPFTPASAIWSYFTLSSYNHLVPIFGQPRRYSPMVAIWLVQDVSVSQRDETGC